MLCTSSEARTALSRFPVCAAALDVSAANEPDLRAVLAEVRAAQRCLDGLAMRIGVRANKLAAEGRSAPATETLRGDGAVGARQARREATRAELGELAGIGEAVSAGEISGEHVDSIARHRARLPEELRDNFDLGSLVTRASGMPPETFDRLVKRRVDKASADRGLADIKAKQASSEFRHWFDRDTGMGRFTGALDPERYEVLTNAIDHHAAAITAAEIGLHKDKNLAARALVELIADVGQSRDVRSRLPSILVVVDQETLVRGSHNRSVCQTEQGHDLPPESLARLACDATFRRVVLDGRGVPIDVGRQSRIATDGQWAAIKAIHTTCAWVGCAAPINWCQAHHINEWEKGGKTDLANLVPLCSRHHHRVHEGRWHIKLLPDRSLKIYRPGGEFHAAMPTPMRC